MSGKLPGRWWALASLALVGLGASPVGGAEAPSGAQADGLVGVVVATRTLDLGPKVAGRLEDLKVRLGERVAAGQVVAQLETQTLQHEHAARQAGVKAAEADVNRNIILLTQAQQRLEREKRIKDYSAAEAVETAENQVALATADVELAKARASEAQARASEAAISLENARVRAPFAGLVSEIYLYPGTQVTQTTPVIRLVSEELRLRFAVPIAQAGLLRVGSTVSARVETLGIVLTGVVDSVSPEVDQASRLLKAEARLDIPASHRGKVPSGLLALVQLGAAPATAQNSGP
ncbi:efflux RND transporter periplasmic adaptor subunit [Hyalangium gracile]|uniref:efflux RND transporter periplasmic adaptor subunit n=1 Tax=Hyalangium gracile TaxID=394092 RepID=UPI001CCF0DF7|nr:efflux RND transporter periplasmic adaptor subunit [Hyalangium gracile]